ncbi:MAG: hypothetical protein IAI50_22015 [Candidatus Eremiobacteraeota bacterium]|nr:hypothetical protein [Candidatus Eremiobacteraeota bacterium]
MRTATAETAAAATPAMPVLAPAAATQQPVAGSTASPGPTTPPAPAMSVAPAPVDTSKGQQSTSPGGAKIYAVVTTPSVVHAGEAVTWDVRTSSDVTGVSAHVSVYTLPLQPRGPGHFVLNFSIPSGVPAIFHGTYDLQLTAHGKNGSSATRHVPMIFQ